jgi:hypothetical protein
MKALRDLLQSMEMKKISNREPLQLIMNQMPTDQTTSWECLGKILITTLNQASLTTKRSKLYAETEMKALLLSLDAL